MKRNSYENSLNDDEEEQVRKDDIKEKLIHVYSQHQFSD